MRSLEHPGRGLKTCPVMARYFHDYSLANPCLSPSFLPPPPTDGTQRPAALWSGVHRWASAQLHRLLPRQHTGHGQHQRGSRGLCGLLLRPLHGLLPIGFTHRHSVRAPIWTWWTLAVACPWTCILIPPYISQQGRWIFCNQLQHQLCIRQQFYTCALAIISPSLKCIYKRMSAIIQRITGGLKSIILPWRTNAQVIQQTQMLCSL